MKKVIIWIVAIIVMIGVVIGCIHWYNVSINNLIENPNNDLNSGDIEMNSGDENEQEKTLFTLENYPKVDASLAIHPLVDSIASDFLGVDESELDFEYTKTRTSEVYRNLIDGKVDVIFAAEISKEDEEYAREQGVELKIIPATSSAFVFIVNTENPVENLTFEQIQKIYTGEITNWLDVGGESGDIIAYQRPTGSGSQTAMLSLVMKDKDIMTPPLTQIEQEMGGLIDAIAEYDNSKYALGYSYFYYVNTMYKKDTIKMVSVNGVMPTIETIKNGTYPIYTNAFIVTRANEENENVDKWIEAVLSERGSKIIEDAGYVPVERESDVQTEKEDIISKEYYLITDDNKKVILNEDIKLFNKEPISFEEGRGDGFHWKNYVYDDMYIQALIGYYDGVEYCNTIKTTSNNYKTPRGIKVGDSLQKLQEKYPTDLEKALTDPWYNIYIYHPENSGVGFNRIFFSLENDIITEIKLENGIDG